MSTAVTGVEFSVIALDKFIQATRDSGYKGTTSAIAELVDNAVQAGATRIAISVLAEGDGDQYPLTVSVSDNGSGMDPATLRQALRFGGSTRFNDRDGLGRYGMGLPNSSLSQARRVTVYTWQASNDVHSSYLDVDEIAAGAVTEVPEPTGCDRPFDGDFDESGTIVRWSGCDRLDNRRVSTIATKLSVGLGRRFRYFLWDGVSITINGEPVAAFDPLYLNSEAQVSGAEIFGKPIEYEVSADPAGNVDTTGLVRVTFSELPVQEWQGLSNREKREFGIAKGAGVSIVRARREVDYGWFFLSGKRRENYDDWWRCEIQFDPVLDEAFGITHTKQQARPRPFLVEEISPDIETTARVLNSRARKAHVAVKVVNDVSKSESVAAEKEDCLEPLPAETRERDRKLLKTLKKSNPLLRKGKEPKSPAQMAYTIVESTVSDSSFFTFARRDHELILVLNPSHPFYEQVYRPLVESDAPHDRYLRTQLELLLLSAARSEASVESASMAQKLEHQRKLWSDTLAVFLGD